MAWSLSGDYDHITETIPLIHGNLWALRNTETIVTPLKADDLVNYHQGKHFRGITTYVTKTCTFYLKPASKVGVTLAENLNFVTNHLQLPEL